MDPIRCTSPHADRISRLGPRNAIVIAISRFAQKLRQLGDVRRDPPRVEISSLADVSRIESRIALRETDPLAAVRHPRTLP